MDTNTHEEKNTDYANGIDEKLREEAGPQLCSLLVPVLVLVDWKVAQQRRTPTPKAFARPRFAWKHSCPFVVKPQKIVRILLAADGANQIQARGCAARRIAYEKNS